MSQNHTKEGSAFFPPQLIELARANAAQFPWAAEIQRSILDRAQPWMKFGTDAGGVDPGRSGTLTHPRAYGTFPRILGKYVREERIMSLEEAIRKMTSAVTNRLSIQDRGLLREGYFADIVVFNPATISDMATYEQPHQVSQGMRWVLVNGTVVLRAGEHTGALPGRILRGPGFVPQ